MLGLQAIQETVGSQVHGHDLLLFLSGSLDDLDAGAGPDAIGAGVDHLPRVFVRLDSPGGLDPHVRAHHAAHQSHIRSGGPSRPEAGGGLHEVGTGGLGELARRDLLLVGQQSRLDDDLEEGSPGVTSPGDGRDVLSTAS